MAIDFNDRRNNAATGESKGGSKKPPKKKKTSTPNSNAAQRASVAMIKHSDAQHKGKTDTSCSTCTKLRVKFDEVKLAARAEEDARFANKQKYKSKNQ
jgi:hypothetical protein